MSRALTRLLIFAFLYALPAFSTSSETLLILERSAKSTFTQELYQTLQRSSFDSTVHISFVDSFYSSLTPREKSEAFPDHYKSVMLIAGIDETTPITRIISQGTSPGIFLEDYPTLYPAAERIFTHILWTPSTGQMLPSDINLQDSIHHIARLFPSKSRLLLVGNYDNFSNYFTALLLEEQSNHPGLTFISSDYQQSQLAESVPGVLINDSVALVTHAPISQEEKKAFNWLLSNNIPVLFLFGNRFDLNEHKNVGGLVVSPVKLGSLIEKIINNKILSDNDRQVTVALYHNDAIEKFGLNPKNFSDDYEVIGREEYSYEDIQIIVNAGLIISTIFLCLLLLISFKNRKLINERARIAEDANREKDKLMANISHELRTPLNSIHLAFEALTDTPADKSPKIIDAGQRATQHLKNIVNTILDYQKSSNSKTSISLAWLNKDDLKNAIKIHQYHATNKALQFDIKGMKSLPTFVKTDEKLLLQILHNVLSNALKFTEHGSVKVLFKHSESRLYIDIVDSGIGMDQTALESVFIPFKQANTDNNKRYKGTGLGMPLCKTLVTLLEGEINITSQTGEGTRVSLSFPVEWQNESIPSVTDAPSCEYLPLSVLVVEDDEIGRELFNHILQNRVQKLIIAASAEDALTVTKGYDFDVVLTDIRMPDMDGVDLFKALHQREPELPIIAVTGNASAKERAQYLALGFTDVIAKPFEVQTIMLALQLLESAVN